MGKMILAAGMLLAAAVLSGRELQVNGNFRKINKTTNTPGAWSTDAKKDTVETKVLPGRNPGMNAFQIRTRKEVCYYAGPQNVEKGEKITFSADVKGKGKVFLQLNFFGSGGSGFAGSRRVAAADAAEQWSRIAGSCLVEGEFNGKPVRTVRPAFGAEAGSEVTFENIRIAVSRDTQPERK